jgi:hypothetical protein
MTTVEIPRVSKRFFCIVDIDKFQLGAVICSYVGAKREYTPMFQFPRVTASKPAPSSEIVIDEHHLSVSRAEEMATRLSNALSFLGGCEYLILGGLTNEQKSFLCFLDRYNVIEVDAIDRVDLTLGALTNKTRFISCNENDIHAGLAACLSSGCLIKIDNSAENISLSSTAGAGLVVIEKEDSFSDVVAVNYAASVNCNIAVISKPSTDKKEVKYLIERWRETSDQKYFNDLSALLYKEVAEIPFDKFPFCTFFTFGAPYSLVLNNIIPFTYVNTNLNPDFFVFNNLIYSNRREFHSAIVFSPLEFQDEETEFVINHFEAKGYYVRTLTGKQASTFNIENHIREYPFEVLHICSHGGEVPGYAVVEEFTDRDGNSHLVEYDEVASYSLDGIGDDGLIPVTIKRIWRRFDKLPWQSEELESKNYEHHVFVDMIKKMTGKEVISRIRIGNVVDSCAIKCSDSNYQAMVNAIAGHQTYPFIYNNTCWSWSGISEHLLGAGARGYIGTLWSIENEVAKNTSEAFYEHAFNDTLSNALHKAMVHTKGHRDENVYIFWGLHFSRFSQGTSIERSKIEVAKRLVQSVQHLREHITEVRDKKTKEMITRIIKWLSSQLFEYFRREVIMIGLGIL